MGRRFDVELDEEAKEEKSRKRKINVPSACPLELKQTGEVKKEVEETGKKQKGDFNMEKAYFVPTSVQSFPAIKHLKIVPTVVKSESIGSSALIKIFNSGFLSMASCIFFAVVSSSPYLSS